MNDESNENDQTIGLLLSAAAWLFLIVVLIFHWGPKNAACKDAGGSLTQDGICVKDILK